MLVIGRIAGRDLARPVERQPHRLQLLLHRRDVVVGPRLRVHLAVDRRVLRRHAEGVPAHRMQHGVAHGAFVARHHVAHGVVAHVAHMDAPRRVGEHLEHVVFRARVVVLGGEDAALVPRLLPAGLGRAGVIALVFARIGGHFRLFLGCAEQTRKSLAGQPVEQFSGNIRGTMPLPSGLTRCITARGGQPGRKRRYIMVNTQSIKEHMEVLGSDGAARRRRRSPGRHGQDQAHQERSEVRRPAPCHPDQLGCQGRRACPSQQAGQGRHVAVAGRGVIFTPDLV